jgi:hypothetical protein
MAEAALSWIKGLGLLEQACISAQFYYQIYYQMNTASPPQAVYVAQRISGPFGAVIELGQFGDQANAELACQNDYNANPNP